MRLYNVLKIEMLREQKEKLCDAYEVFFEIYNLLKENKANGGTPWQEGLEIYDDFYKIYNICLEISEKELIP